MPNGMKITFLTVGGRTSAVVPEVQKKTGPVSADMPVESDIVSENADHTNRNGRLSENEKKDSKKRTASRAVVPSKPSKGKRQRPDKISDVKEVNYDILKSKMREELKEDLKEELLSELKQELKRAITLELKQARNATNGSKSSKPQASSNADDQLKSYRDIENSVTVNGGARRRSARLNG